MSRSPCPASATARLPPLDRKRNTRAVQTVQLLDVTPHEVVALKPAGLASELPRDPAADSLVHRLAAQGFSGLRLVHRLDAPSCGLMLLARSAEAAAHYAREIAARRWHKWYVAQVALPLPKAEQLVGAHKSYLRVDGASARVVHAGGQCEAARADGSRWERRALEWPEPPRETTACPPHGRSARNGRRPSGTTCEHPRAARPSEARARSGRRTTCASGARQSLAHSRQRPRPSAPRAAVRMTARPAGARAVGLRIPAPRDDARVSRLPGCEGARWPGLQASAQRSRAA